MVNIFVRAFSIFFWAVVILILLIVPPKLLNSFETKTLNIFTWSSLLDPHYFKKFQEETGIKINISYYESNEELLGKLGAGDSGYDLIVPSDYAVYKLIKKGVLKQIDTSRLTFFDKLDTRLMHNYFDPQNEYSIPYFWGVYGIIINTDYYPHRVPESFSLIFDQHFVVDKICMPGNAREVVLMATYYLFDDFNALLDPAKREQVKDLLIAQKKWVACYSDERTEYSIVSRTCTAVLALNPDLWRIKRDRAKSTAEFILPQEASFVVIDNFAIPKASSKEDLIYTFLNYLYSDSAMFHHAQQFGMCMPIEVGVMQEQLPAYDITKNIRSLTFFHTEVPDEILNEVWMALMAA